MLHSNQYDFNMTSDELEAVFGFYRNACNTFGLAQPFQGIQDFTEENLDDAIEIAKHSGFDPLANRSDTKLQNAILEAKVNDGHPKVFTSYYGNVKHLDRFNVVKVRIALIAPRYIKAHDKYLELAPTKEMLDGVKDGSMTSEEFKDHYYESLLSLDAEQVYANLCAIGIDKTTGVKYDVALMCYEPNGETCHRHYVTNWFKDNEIIISEFPYKGE